MGLSSNYIKFKTSMISLDRARGFNFSDFQGYGSEKTAKFQLEISKIMPPGQNER